MWGEGQEGGLSTWREVLVVGFGLSLGREGKGKARGNAAFTLSSLESRVWWAGLGHQSHPASG